MDTTNLVSMVLTATPKQLERIQQELRRLREAHEAKQKGGS